MKFRLPLLALLLVSCSPASNPTPEIAVDEAWARATLEGKTVTSAYLTISNRGSVDDALIGVSSSTGPAAIHSTSMSDGIMRMRHLDRLAIPAGTTVKLEPGGAHLMLTGLRAPMAPGTSIELGLRFEKSPERKMVAQVRAPSGEQM